MSDLPNETDELLPIGEIKKIAGIGKTMIYRLEREGAFPKRYKPGGYASRWSRSEVIAWREQRRACVNVVTAGDAICTPQWQTQAAHGLEAAIADFKAHLPGWWFSLCECQVSCDASCAPTKESPHIAFIRAPGDQWDDGFHADLPQPSTLAEALRAVMFQALEAIHQETRQ